MKNIVKLQLNDFNSRKNFEQVSESFIEKIEPQNQIFEDESKSEAIELSLITDPTPVLDSMIGKSNELDLQNILLMENNLITEKLNGIKISLLEIEKQQEDHFSELSKNILIFIKNFIVKIIANPIINKLIIDKVLNHIDEILRKIKDRSSLNVKIPKDLSETFKASLVETFKNAASKFNIEVTEHNNNQENILIEWQNGRAELEVNNPLKDIENELTKYDTKN